MTETQPGRIYLVRKSWETTGMIAAVTAATEFGVHYVTPNSSGPLWMRRSEWDDHFVEPFEEAPDAD